MAEYGIWWLLLGRRVWATWGEFWSACGPLAAWGRKAAATQVAARLGQASRSAGSLQGRSEWQNTGFGVTPEGRARCGSHYQTRVVTVPCLPQMGQDKVWPAQRQTMQCVGSQYLAEIGLHWKLTTHKTEILQTNLNPVLPQSQTRVVTSPPVGGPGKGVAYSTTYHTTIWQPVLGETRPTLETNHPYKRNPANQCCFDQGGHECPVCPRCQWARKRCGPPKHIPYSVWAACTRMKEACTGN